MFSTPGEKRGMLDGISLFFGALIGTNLGSADGLSSREYLMLIVMLSGTVMSIRIFSTTERRWYGFSLLGAYAFLVGHFLFFSKISAGIPIVDREKLAITLIVWTGTVMLAEFVPVRQLPEDLRQGRGSADTDDGTLATEGAAR